MSVPEEEESEGEGDEGGADRREIGKKTLVTQLVHAHVYI